MSTYLLPEIGSSGTFELLAPFDDLIVAGERYTCQGIRTLGELKSNSEDPAKDIYEKYGILDSHYEDHLSANMPIVSLQSDLGHWLSVPAEFIKAYPSYNGIAYRSYVIGVALPAVPITQDLSVLEQAISNLVTDTIGVTPSIKPVENSRIVLVTKEDHIQTQARRNLNITNTITDRAKYMTMLEKEQVYLDKIAQLEQHIIATQQP